MSSSRPRFTINRLLIVLAAAAALGVASQVEVPVRPVPITLQSLAVVLIGFLVGPVNGFAAVSVWLASGALGLPLFAGGEAGMNHLTGPTAGYLFAFPFAAALAGYAVMRRDERPGPIRLFLAAVAAHLLILALGGAGLAAQIGMLSALEKGVLPFILGSLVKSAVAALLASALGRREA